MRASRRRAGGTGGGVAAEEHGARKLFAGKHVGFTMVRLHGFGKMMVPAEEVATHSATREQSYVNSTSITGIWNFIASEAYHAHKCDYFYPANDDLVLITAGWTARAVERLAACPLRPNFGVAAFTDIWLYSSPTFHLTHRTHLDLFGGLYYPIPSEGAHQDSWAFSVYQEWGCGTKFSSVKVRNRVRNATTTAGGRYDYNSNAEACDALEWIAASRPSIAQWLCAELRANLTAIGGGGGERECARALKQRSALAACPASTRYPVLKRPLSVRARETADQRRGRIKAAAISGVAQCRANVPTVCTACAS